jgi:nucleoside-diphosphate-sugar epimerase
MKILVTGGGGFIGSALVRKLVAKGFEVSTFSRKYYPHHSKLGVRIFQGDLINFEDIETACGGIDVVFHTAARVGVWGSYDEFFATNVIGTQNVIHSCKVCKVKKLIFTSSASVVFNGSDLLNADESSPYPRKPVSSYTATKAIAEQIVLDANSEELKTLALRPHLVWGPGDTQLIPGIINRAKTGRLRRIGKKDYQIDTTYIENYINAQLLAMNMMFKNPDVCGRAYFITNDEPVNGWDFINSVLASAGMTSVSGYISKSLALFLAYLIEKVHILLGLKTEPILTRLIVHELCTHHWFNIKAAKELLGYSPQINIKTGMEMLRHTFVEDYSEKRN